MLNGGGSSLNSRRSSSPTSTLNPFLHMAHETLTLGCENITIGPFTTLLLQAVYLYLLVGTHNKGVAASYFF